MLKPFHPSLAPYWRPSVFGAAFGVLLVLGSLIIGTRSFLAFFSVGGLLVVVGGVIAVAFMSYDQADVQKALQSVRTMLDPPQEAEDQLHDDMTEIVGWARVFKEKGLLGLESNLLARRIEDPFVRYGLNMVLSEYGPDDVRAMMETAADATYERDYVPIDVLHAMASHAPAFGMVGTLIGMVALLGHLDASISGMGASLAVAFLSTLYGVVTARMVYMPAASKLESEVAARRFRKQLIVEGIFLLASEKAPMFIQDRLNSFLRPEAHDYFNVLRKPTPRPHLKAVGT